jgi:DNA-binding response OmpR family regulator
VQYKVLVAEDDFLLAAELVSALLAANFIAIGPVSTAAAALEIVRAGGCDVAILDFQIRGGTSEPVASALRGEGIPFVVSSGTITTAKCFAGAPSVPKPVSLRALLSELRRLVGQQISVRGKSVSAHQQLGSAIH